MIRQAQPDVRPQRRGSEERYAFPHDVYLTPLDERQQPLRDQSVRVQGKHISSQGLEFVHTALLPYRHMTASLPLPDGRCVELLLELTWCRFVRRDQYENGGRFLRVVEPVLQPELAMSAAAADLHDALAAWDPLFEQI